jgi:hypothetical protein
MLRNSCCSICLALAATAWLCGIGCNREATDRSSSTAVSRGAGGERAAIAPADESHGHQPGAHGGMIVSIGGDSFHAEAMFEAGGSLRLFMLGSDETRVLEIEAQQLVAYVKAAGDSASTSVILQPELQPGESEGNCSQFVGQLPDELSGQELSVTIPNVRIGGERFRIAFTSAAQEHEDPIPDKVADDDERQLYLTPGGLYTQADIEANGHVTASERFAAFKASHDLHPQPGEKICPITLTKANPECSWVIGGKSYEFCCPPCVDEFVKLAKEHPEDVQEPETYVK